MSETKIMLGNEAIARGAYEAGVKVSAAYPGTPSTEISENIVQYHEIYAVSGCGRAVMVLFNGRGKRRGISKTRHRFLRLRQAGFLRPERRVFKNGLFFKIHRRAGRARIYGSSRDYGLRKG